MSDLRKASLDALEAMETYVKQYPHMDKGYMLDAREALKKALIETPEVDAEISAIEDALGLKSQITVRAR